MDFTGYRFVLAAVLYVVIITNRDRFKRQHLFNSTTRWQSRGVPVRLKLVPFVQVLTRSTFFTYTNKSVSCHVVFSYTPPSPSLFFQDFSFDLISPAPWGRDTSVTTATDPSKTTCTTGKNT